MDQGHDALVTLELVGVAEIAVMMQCSQQRVHQLLRKPDWPPPVAHLTIGRIWLRQDIEAWLANHPLRSRRGRPPKGQP